MRNEDRVRMQHMRDAAWAAVRYTDRHGRRDLDADELAAHGLVRLIEIVGEAAARVTAETRLACPAIPWQAIIAMRNRLVHGYFDVDLDIVWNTLTVDLPPLIVELDGALAAT